MGEGRKEKMPSLLALPSVPDGTHCECQSGLRIGPGEALWDSRISYTPPPPTPAQGGKKDPG